MNRRVHQIILGLDETPVKAPQYRSASGGVRDVGSSPAMNPAPQGGRLEVRDMHRLGSAKRFRIDGSQAPSPRKLGGHSDPACPSQQAADCTGGVSSSPPSVPFNNPRDQWIAAEIEKAKQ